MTSVMMLCAGYGTRLTPLTRELPKPMLPLGDRPLLEHLIGYVRQHGLEDIAANTHHLPEKFTRFFSNLSFKVQVRHEPSILGTAGALHAAAQVLGSPILLWNGDAYARPDLAPLLASAGDREVLGLVIRGLPVGLGPLGIDRDGRVCRLRGERFGLEQSGGDYLGIGLFGTSALDRLPERGCVIGDLCLPWLRAGLPIQTWTHHGYAFDIGTLEGYLKANACWLSERGLDNYVAADARVTRPIERSVIGGQARVDAKVRDCVVWPEARVERPLRRAVVTTAGRIVLAA